jgi:cell division protein FtsQ
VIRAREAGRTGPVDDETGAAPAGPGPIRYRGRRRTASAVLVLLALLATGLGGREALLHVARFRVDRVEVLGTAPAIEGLVRAAAGVAPGMPLLAVDTSAVRLRVAAIPRFDGVRVRRSWPSTVVIEVTERTPVALAASPAGPLLVDGTGLAFQRAPRPPPPLPRLAAARVAPDDPATRAGLAVLAALPPWLHPRVRVVEAADRYAVTLRLDDGTRVRWGSPDDSPRKAAVLRVLRSQRAQIYDVSAPDLPTIRR